jgi:hypothetical protein
METGTTVPWGVVWFGGDVFFSMDWVLSTGMFPCGNYFVFPHALVMFAVFCTWGFVMAFFLLPKNDGQRWQLLAWGTIVVFTLILAIAYLIPDESMLGVTNPAAVYFGSTDYFPSSYKFTGGEADLGAILYFFLFLWVPLQLLYYGYNGFPGKWGKVKAAPAAVEQ